MKAVQTLLGHKSAAMTLDTYSDLFPNDLDAVATKLDEAVRAQGVGVCGYAALRLRSCDFGASQTSWPRTSATASVILIPRPIRPIPGMVCTAV